jgi:hypothetical protein
MVCVLPAEIRNKDRKLLVVMQHIRASFTGIPEKLLSAHSQRIPGPARKKRGQGAQYVARAFDRYIPAKSEERTSAPQHIAYI